MSLKQRESPRVDLIGVRRVIDGIDDGLLILLAARRRLVGAATQIKSQSDRVVPLSTMPVSLFQYLAFIQAFAL